MLDTASASNCVSVRQRERERERERKKNKTDNSYEELQRTRGGESINIRYIAVLVKLCIEKKKNPALEVVRVHCSPCPSL